MSSTAEPEPQRQIRIWQQNLNKSLAAQEELLHSLDPKSFDIIILQEPYFDHFNNTRANCHWRPLLPWKHMDRPPRSSRAAILVNTNLSTNSYVQLPVDSPDVVALRLETERSSI